MLRFFRWWDVRDKYFVWGLYVMFGGISVCDYFMGNLYGGVYLLIF